MVYHFFIVKLNRIKQIRIRVEHTIGLLKGRFQSLFQLRIQVYDHKKHLWAIMWIRCCIILHNLIIQLERDAVDKEWRQEMYNEWYAREGAAHRLHFNREDLQQDSDNADNIPRRRAMTEGERFRHRVMNSLFDSPTSGAVRRT